MDTSMSLEWKFLKIGNSIPGHFTNRQVLISHSNYDDLFLRVYLVMGLG